MTEVNLTCKVCSIIRVSIHPNKKANNTEPAQLSLHRPHPMHLDRWRTLETSSKANNTNTLPIPRKYTILYFIPWEC